MKTITPDQIKAAAQALDVPVAALRAVTRDPAEMMGISDKVGMLAPGRDADIVVWSGEPLEIASRVEKIWVGGSARNLSADNGGAATWQ